MKACIHENVRSLTYNNGCYENRPHVPYSKVPEHTPHFNSELFSSLSSFFVIVYLRLSIINNKGFKFKHLY